MRALVGLVALLTSGCGDTEIQVCTVDLQVTRDRSMTSMDCGTLVRGDVNFTDAAFLEAQRCVLRNIVAKQPFHLVYDTNNAVTGQVGMGLRAGWVGTLQGDTLRIRAYAGNAQIGIASSDDFVSAQPCTKVDATPSCSPRMSVPCLSCTTTATDIGQVLCRGS